MMTIFCGNSIAIRNMKFPLRSGQFVMNLRSTVPLRLVNWLKWLLGDQVIPIWFTHCELIQESSRILIGIQRRRICWPAAPLTHSRICGTWEIQRNRPCRWVPFACVNILTPKCFHLFSLCQICLLTNFSNPRSWSHSSRIQSCVRQSPGNSSWWFVVEIFSIAICNEL